MLLSVAVRDDTLANAFSAELGKFVVNATFSFPLMLKTTLPVPAPYWVVSPKSSIFKTYGALIAPVPVLVAAFAVGLFLQ